MCIKPKVTNLKGLTEPEQTTYLLKGFQESKNPKMFSKEKSNLAYLLLAYNF